MKKLIAFILVALLGYLIISSLYTDDLEMMTSSNRDTDIADRYIGKSVTEEVAEVTYNESNDLENGSANIVTAVVADYRSFDTLGEVTVLFAASLGVALLLGTFTKRFVIVLEENKILSTGARIVVGLMIVLGAYMFTHGHLSPGGGFPGGSIIGGAILLLYLADNAFRLQIGKFKVTESIAGIVYVGLGIAGLLVATYFLENFLPTGTVGHLISAGIIPIVYVVIGLKVGSEIAGIIDKFITEEVAS